MFGDFNPTQHTTFDTKAYNQTSQKPSSTEWSTFGEQSGRNAWNFDPSIWHAAAAKQDIEPKFSPPQKQTQPSPGFCGTYNQFLNKEPPAKQDYGPKFSPPQKHTQPSPGFGDTYNPLASKETPGQWQAPGQQWTQPPAKQNTGYDSNRLFQQV